MRDMEASGWVDERGAGVGRIRYFLPPFQGSALLVRYLGFRRSGSTLGYIPAAAARLQIFGVSPDDPAQRLNVTPALESRFPEEQPFRCHNQIVALHIEHREAERLAEELSAHTDESITEAVVKALRLVSQNIDSKTIKQAAVRKGMRTLRGDGALKVLQGITSSAEVLRATEEEGNVSQI